MFKNILIIILFILLFDFVDTSAYANDINWSDVGYYNDATADYKKDRMGLNTWKKNPLGKILKPDVSIAKNYLNMEELESLDRIVTMYLDYAEDRAKRNIPMTMQDWSEKLNAFLKFNEREILDHPGKIKSEVAKAFAESEFEKYRVIQDRLFESDFDKHLKHSLQDIVKDLEKENAGESASN